MKLIPLLILCAALPVRAEVYKSVTPEGEVVYSDTPATAGARPMNVPEITTYKPVPVQQLEPVQQPEDITAVYKSFVIDSPANESTIRDNVGNIELLVTLEPELIAQQGHRIQYYLDGKPHGRRTLDLRKVYTGLDRGAHELSAEVLDDNGRALISTPPVTVFLHKASVQHRFNPLNPNNPNNPPAGSPAS